MKYRVELYTPTFIVEVEAESKDDAREMAYFEYDQAQQSGDNLLRSKIYERA